MVFRTEVFYFSVNKWIENFIHIFFWKLTADGINYCYRKNSMECIKLFKTIAFWPFLYILIFVKTYIGDCKGNPEDGNTALQVTRFTVVMLHICTLHQANTITYDTWCFELIVEYNSHPNLKLKEAAILLLSGSTCTKLCNSFTF